MQLIFVCTFFPCGRNNSVTRLDILKEKGLIDFTYKAKSIYVFEEGLQKANLLLGKYKEV